MPKKSPFILFGIVMLITAFGMGGCQPTTGQDGIHVMFDGTPKIYHSEVYSHGRVIGKILNQQGTNGSVSNVTITIDPKVLQHAGQHWAFYVDGGRLTAGVLNTMGQPIAPGDRLCGFHSKAGLNWFKIKTLLSHRIAEANRRAQKLYLRYTQSG